MAEGNRGVSRAGLVPHDQTMPPCIECEHASHCASTDPVYTCDAYMGYMRLHPPRVWREMDREPREVEEDEAA